MSHVIRFPNLTFSKASSLVEQLRQLPASNAYILDFEAMKWVEPFPMLHVASAIQRAMEAHPASSFGARGFSDKTYASFMGFFREAGLEVGPAVGQISDHKNYLPINVLDLNSVKQEAELGGQAAGRVIERYAGNIARTMIQQNHGKLWETLQYAIREVIRNVSEHSQSRYAFYCGQYWPEKRQG